MTAAGVQPAIAARALGFASRATAVRISIGPCVAPGLARDGL
jgi:hypothetical protein